jgi:hypothetical protein
MAADDTGTTAAAPSDATREAFRDALHNVIQRVGFPHEQDVIDAYNAVDRFLGYEVAEPPYSGPLFDPATGVYIGPGQDPRTAPAVETAPAADVAAPA